jgi:hypothetical protein
VLDEALRQAILSRISTGRILARAADLEAEDRLPGGPGLEQACTRVAQRLQASGALQVELLRFGYGSERRHFSWSLQRRPFPTRGELWLQTPEGGEVLLCRRSDHLACSMGAYRSTPQEGEVLEVVDVGFGTRASDYRAHRMAGKLALASGHHFQAAMLEALANRGAEGLLCGPGNVGSGAGQLVHRELADPEVFGEHRPFGFNLSARQYHRLLNRLAAGDTVQVRVKLEATTDTGVLPAVEAVLPGSDLATRRVLLVADTAQALSVACLEEVLRTLSELVVDGVCPPPRRGLQLLAAPGVAGTVAWLAEQRERPSQPMAALVLGLVSPVAASQVQIQRSPAGRPSFISDLLEDHLRWAAGVEGSYRTDLPLTFRSVSYAGRSPALPFADRDVAVPAAWVRCDQEPRLRPGAHAPHGPVHRLVGALTCAALDLCSVGADDLPRLLSGSHVRGLQRLGRRAERLRQRVQQELLRDPGSSTTGRHLLWLAETAMGEGMRREKQVLDTCCDYLSGPGQQALRLAELTADLEQSAAGLTRSLHAEVSAAMPPRSRLTLRRAPLSALERRADAVVAHRLFSGPLPTPLLLREAPEAERHWLAHHMDVLADQPTAEELVQWVDGRRSLLEIFDLVRLDHPEADLKLLWRYLEALQGAGLLELRERTGISEA